MVKIRTILVPVLLALACGCTCPEPAARAKPLEAQTVIFELYVSKKAELPDKTGMYIVTDKFVCGTRIGLVKKNPYNKGIVYRGKMVTIPGARRYFVVKPPKKHAEVFIMTVQATPDEIEWIPWAKPDFIEKSDEPTWSLQNSINADQQVRNIPNSDLKLRYHVEHSPVP